jgi:hypothetical protein
MKLQQLNNVNAIYLKAATVQLLLFSLVLYFYEDISSFAWLKHSINVPLYQHVTTDGIIRHLEALYKIALNEGKGSRHVEKGFNASAAYVIKQLQEHTDCQLSTMPFPYTGRTMYSLNLKFSDSGAPVNIGPDDAIVYSFQEAKQQGLKVYRADKLFCSFEEYQNIPEGHAVSFPYNLAHEECSIEDSLDLAEKAGVVAVLRDMGPAEAWAFATFEGSERKEFDQELKSLVDKKGLLFIMNNPSLGMYFSKKDTEFLLDVEVTDEIGADAVDTFNVICETREGDANSVVIVGAHLDSVAAGPGVIDDGSGSSTILEVFLQLYKTGLNKKLKNKLRFVWFSAEEAGLIGSKVYNSYLNSNPAEKEKVVLYVNQDMLGSSNGIPIVRDGNTARNATLKEPCMKITQSYAEYFDSDDTRGTIYHSNYATGQIHTGEDQNSFVSNGIPGGGVANGAGSKKTVEEQRRFGGLANVPYDPCYHQPCDDLDNINKDLLRVLSKSCAFVVEKFGTMDNIREWLWSY